MRKIRSLVLTIFIFVLSCHQPPRGGPYKDYPAVDPQWSGPVTRIDLNRDAPWVSTAGVEGVEFSTDGSLICVYCFVFGEAYIVVFDMQGRAIPDAVSDNGYLAPAYHKKFYRAALFSSSHLSGLFYRDKLVYGSKLLKALSFSDVLAKSSSWSLNADRNECLMMVCPPASPDQISHTPKNIELWQLGAERKKIWSQQLPIENRDWVEGGFYTHDKQEMCFVADWEWLYIMSHHDGRIIKEIHYGDPVSDEVEKSRSNLVDPDHIIPPMETPFLRFISHHAEVSSQLKLFTAGEGNGRRVRIFSLVPPYQKVAELNELDCPYWPKGAFWQVDRVNFVGDHYLCVKYAYAKRSLLKGEIYNPTDIFDTRTWKRVWHANKEGIDNVTLSPDGEKLAFTRNKVLEIGAFQPVE